MNKQRRAAIEKIRFQLEQLNESIDAYKQEEQEYHDNMPESFQSGEKGQKAEDAISNLEDAYNSVDDAINSLNSAVEE